MSYRVDRENAAENNTVIATADSNKKATFFLLVLAHKLNKITKR